MELLSMNVTKSGGIVEWLHLNTWKTSTTYYFVHKNYDIFSFFFVASIVCLACSLCKRCPIPVRYVVQFTFKLWFFVGYSVAILYFTIFWMNVQLQFFIQFTVVYVARVFWTYFLRDFCPGLFCLFILNLWLYSSCVHINSTLVQLCTLSFSTSMWDSFFSFLLHHASTPHKRDSEEIKREAVYRLYSSGVCGIEITDENKNKKRTQKKNFFLSLSYHIFASNYIRKLLSIWSIFFTLSTLLCSI